MLVELLVSVAQSVPAGQVQRQPNRPSQQAPGTSGSLPSATDPPLCDHFVVVWAEVDGGGERELPQALVELRVVEGVALV